MKKISLNRTILNTYKIHPISFIPPLAHVTKSATAGLFLSQLLYWHGKGAQKDWVYKTVKEFQRETGLTRSQQERAIKKWTELGVLTVENRGVPMKRHFKIDIGMIHKSLEPYKIKDEKPIIETVDDDMNW